MMSLQAFAERCGGLIKQHTPFIAYRHDRGCALLILDGGEITEYTIKYKYRDEHGKPRTAQETTTDPKRLAMLLDRPSADIIKTKVTRKTPMAATVTGFRRAIDKMKKDPRTRGSLCTVECDGHGYSIEGGGLADLIGAIGL